ncbi:MAG: cytochrome c3 family protein [Firmicutes bacterium]|nr:cytochrome c3 family protein [Bacillota bacterium]
MPAVMVALLAALLFGGWMGSFFSPPGEWGIGVADAAIGGVCAVCHSSVVSRSDFLPHSRSGGVEGWKPVNCEECHPAVKGHASRIDAQNSPERCGKCHFAGGDAGKGQAKQLPQKLLLGKTEWNGSRHQAAKLGCTRCHNMHNPGARPLLARPSTALCLECHGEIKKHGKLKSVGEAAVRDNCTACHDPHGGKKNTLPSKQASPWEFNRKYVHWPVAQGMCDSCHNPHLPGAGPGETGQEGAPEVRDLLVTPVGEICYVCHGDKQEPITKIAHGDPKIEGANRQNPCLTCHTPHSSDFEHLTVYESNRLCLGCHANKTPHHFLTVRLDVRNKLKCVDCHDPHGNGNRALLKQTRGNLCLQCHNM